VLVEQGGELVVLLEAVCMILSSRRVEARKKLNLYSQNKYFWIMMVQVLKDLANGRHSFGVSLRPAAKRIQNPWRASSDPAVSQG
jgi:hypothetical protein